MRNSCRFHLYVWIACSTIISVSLGCQIPETINLLIHDDWDVDQIIWSSGPQFGTISNDTAFVIGPDGYDHASVFKPVISRNPTDGSFILIFAPGDKFLDYVDLLPRSKETDVRFLYICDGDVKQSTILATWVDKNTRSPEFVVRPETKLNFTIYQNWDKTVPLTNTEEELVQISDKDHDFANTRPVILSPSRGDVLSFQMTHLYREGDPIPVEYLANLRFFIKDDYELVAGTSVDVEIIVSDGTNIPSTRSIIVTIQVQSRPCPSGTVRFSQTYYHHKFTSWPRQNTYFEPNPPISSSIVGGGDGEILYFLRSTDVQFTDFEGIDPRMVIFTRDVSPDEGKQLLVVEVMAKVGDDCSNATVGLILEYPPICNISI